MDYKKTNAPLNTVTRDMISMAEQTGNVYETVCIIGKRANQISQEMKKGTRQETSGVRLDRQPRGRCRKTASR